MRIYNPFMLIIVGLWKKNKSVNFAKGGRLCSRKEKTKEFSARYSYDWQTIRKIKNCT